MAQRGRTETIAHRPIMRPLLRSLLAGAALPLAAPAAGQDTGDSGDGAPTANVEDGVPQGRGQVYTPDYFAQFAPRNALDMVVRIPGFTIVDQGNNQRGLGEANRNVLVNGERFSSKSDSVRDQLSRISAGDVVRIEIVDGTTLDIPGLTGQVANVVVESAGASGQFSWRTGFRPYNTEAQLYGGEISLTGSSGKFDYTVSLSNANDRFGADGPNLVTDRDGQLIETQTSKLSGAFDNPKLSANFTYRFSGDTVANLNLSYGEDFFYRNEPEIGVPVAGPTRTRFFRIRENGPEYEIGGDIEFPLIGGTMKLIGLERFERDNFSSVLVDGFDDGRDDTGSRFTQTNAAGERIGRFEYGWRMLSADWQLSGEAAFNRLDRVSGLFELDPVTGAFVELPFPAGTGGVTEDRYESILSYSTQLTPKLALQVTAGGEYSKIEQTGSAANSRTFQRPKGSLSLAWRPEDDFDISIEIRRRVGQLSFGDFLASVSLNNDNQNGGNNSLVPDQSWNVEAEINKGFGAWGSAKLELRQAWFEDFIDYFPLPAGGEARGNVGSAQRTHLQLNGTVKLDPLGWRGAQVEFDAIKRWMRIADPFTGETRPFSNDLIDQFEADFRHDIPDTDWAYGAGLFTFNPAPYSRRFETGRSWEGPVFLNLFAEHKDVFGMTVNAGVRNVLGARNRFRRTVFAASRPDAPILFSEDLDRRVGPIFRFTVSGNF